MNTGERINHAEHELTVDKLAELLLDGGIDTSAWGTGSAKTIAHLHEEICEGESQMIFGSEGITRTVRVAWLDVLYCDPQGDICLLVEDRQEYNDGRKRVRDLSTSLGEKMKPDEDPTDAAIRALGEELGIDSCKSLHIVGHKETTHTPDSYPGLESNYDTYDFVAVLDDSSYKSEGYIEVQSDKTNYYLWKKIHSKNPESPYRDGDATLTKPS